MSTTRITPRVLVRGGHADPVPILMYHAIGTRAKPGFERFTLRPAVFDAHMALLARQGYRTLTVSELMQSRARRSPLPQRTVVLTFDDGYADFHSHVLPVLARYGFTATLYVTSGHVGRLAPWTLADDEGDRPMLTWSQVAEIAAYGTEIGAHSHTHPELDMMPLRVVRDEVTRSREELEDRLAMRIASFAYPFGYFNRAVADTVAEAGFDSACAVNELACSAGDGPMAVPRLSVNADTDVESLQRILDNFPTPASQAFTETKRRLWQAWRHRPYRSSSPAGTDLTAGGAAS